MGGQTHKTGKRKMQKQKFERFSQYFYFQTAEKLITTNVHTTTEYIT